VTRNPRLLLVLVASTLLLAACDLATLLGDDEAAKLEAKREAEGKAVGSACRYSARSIEDCYERSPKTSKAAIFAGWRDMDGYMRENNIQAMAAEPPEPAAPAKASENAADKPKESEAKPTEDKPKTAEAKPAEDKSRGAAAAVKPGQEKNTAAAPREGVVKQSATLPSGVKLGKLAA
jgi:hypothetical protein